MRSAAARPIATAGRWPACSPGAEWNRVASPLARATETMEIALAAAGLPGADFTTDDRLKEVSYGDWEGMTLDEIDAADASVQDRRARDKWRFVPPGGESYAEVCDRIGDWLATLASPTLVVAHAGIARALLFRLTDLAADDAPHVTVAHDRVLLFTRDRVLSI